jgi:flagellar protein FlaI
MHPNWLQSVTRAGFGTGDAGGSPSGIGGGGRKAPGDISLYDLLIAALRQRPEFIIVGEVRGDEAFTLFQAIAVGHAAMGTIHAGSMDELLSRVESSPMNLPRSLLANLDAVIFPMQIRKGERNVRRITNIVEILELDREKGDLVTNTVFRWLPATDEFKFMGRSYLFDKIRDTFGISLEDLRQEMADRADLLLWLQEQQIRDYKMTLGFIRAYYKDKEEIMAQVRDGAAITAEDVAALVAQAVVDDGDEQKTQSA